MSTTSPNFNLILATTSDTVSVTSHIANNFSTLDAVISVSHTGTGQLKNSLALNTPTLTSPALVGTMSGGNVFATTGSFNTITATGGALTINAFTVGTYGIPATIGGSADVLTVVTGNAVWVAPAPGTGANDALSNLGTVAINTNMNTFTAGFVTVNRIITTSGSLTGLTAFQATAGTFAGNVTISGTATINAVNCTGGSITAGGLAVGTYSYPATVGAVNQVLKVVTNNAVWVTHTNTSAYFRALFTVTNLGSAGVSNVVFGSKVFDSASIFNTGATATQVTITASGYYHFMVQAQVVATSAGVTGIVYLATSASAGSYVMVLPDVVGTASRQPRQYGAILLLCTSGDKFGIVLDAQGTGEVSFDGFFSGYKIPDA